MVVASGTVEVPNVSTGAITDADAVDDEGGTNEKPCVVVVDTAVVASDLELVVDGNGANDDADGAPNVNPPPDTGATDSPGPKENDFVVELPKTVLLALLMLMLMLAPVLKEKPDDVIPPL